VPSREWSLRIQDILTSVTEILQRTEAMTLEDFQQNQTIKKAVLYDFVIIGEASRNVPVAIQSKYRNIPWRLMGNMRNVMAHEYFQVDLEIIWHTIQNSFPTLMLQLQELIEQERIN